MKTKIASYEVLFDNNILRGNPLSEELIRFKEEWGSNRRVVIQLFAPELVVEEYKKYFFTGVKKFLAQNIDSSKGLARFMSLSIGSPQFTDRKIFNKASKALVDIGVKTIPTPYNSINFREIARKAVYYEVPFEEKHEKGFKDSLIAETVLWKLKKIPKDTICVFICGDGLLREYLAGFQGKNSNFKIFQSIPEFESELRLLLSEINEEFIEKLTLQARNKFFNPVDPESSLFNEFKIREKINEKYGHLFSNPERHRGWGYLSAAATTIISGETWAPIEQPAFEIGKPVFIERKDGRYLWSSTVVSKRKYEKTFPRTNNLGSNNILEQVLEFEVKWEFSLDKENKITEARLIDIEHTSAIAYDLFGYQESSSPPHTPTSGATISGIGTTPVGGYDEADLYDIWRDMEAEKREKED